MKKYQNLIEQTFDFPTDDFDLANGGLRFHGVPLLEVVERFGTPTKVTYLPKISSNIQHVRQLFRQAMDKYNYKGQYQYCYCTKSSHFSFVLERGAKQ